MAKRGAAMLEMPEPEYAPENGARRTSARPAERSRREPVEDFAGEYDAAPAQRPSDSQGAGQRPGRRAANRSAVRLRLGSRMPQTTGGLIAGGVALLLLLAGVLWLLAVTRTFLLHDARFRIAGGQAIEIEGNHHLKRPQLLAVFADDLGRNIFGVSLDQRKADLEAIPWVERATVMRLLPARLRVSLVERTPVAFVRQGSHIGLVDAHGVLLEMAAGAGEHYSFPVMTGIAASDPLSTRAARMKIFERFTAELDGAGEKNTESLSEVDLSNPEDVRAMVEGQGTTVLVHFGEEQFLERFRKVKELLPQWHAQYPNLASADMRYEHEVPLAMASPKANPPAKPPAKTPAAPIAAHPVVVSGVHAAGPHPLVAPTKPIVPAAVKPPGPLHRLASGFVPAPAVQPWQATAKAAVDPTKSRAGITPRQQPMPNAGMDSVSAAARAGFMNKPQALLSKPQARTVKTPASASKTPGAASVSQPSSVASKPPTAAAAKAPAGAPAKPMASSVANHVANPHAKPSAGKPLVPTDLNPSPQAAQR